MQNLWCRSPLRHSHPLSPPLSPPHHHHLSHPALEEMEDLNFIASCLAPPTDTTRERRLPESVETLPWRGQPLIRVIFPSLLATHSPDGTLSITGFLYLTRLVFFLIAFPPIQKVMSAITPCVPPRRVKLLPDLGVPVFTSDDSEHSAEYRFSLPGVMKSIEHKVGFDCGNTQRDDSERKKLNLNRFREKETEFESIQRGRS